jgi:antitoxin ParD1/3/4
LNKSEKESLLTDHIPNLALICFWCDIGVFLHQIKNMSRQSISFTEPNNEWLNSLVESKEYSSKSEIINDLIRKARESAKEVEFIRMKLALAEKSGFTNESAAEILAESKRRMNG